jgi:hypothetical protein
MLNSYEGSFKRGLFSMTDQSKRLILPHIMKYVGEVVGNFEEGVKEARQKAALDDFFESDEARTAFLSDDILLETARIEGIETQGREMIDIAKELFLKKGGFS